MKTRKLCTKVVMLVLITVLLACVWGCGKKNIDDVSENTNEDNTTLEQEERLTDVEISSDNNDIIRFTLNNTDEDFYMMYEESDGIISLINPNGIIEMQGCLLSSYWYQQYYDAAEENCELIARDIDNNINYMMYTYERENEGRVYEILGWIIGSDTGVVFEGNDDKDETLRNFIRMSVAVVTTNQLDSNYVYDPEIGEIEDNGIVEVTEEDTEEETTLSEEDVTDTSDETETSDTSSNQTSEEITETNTETE